MAGAAGGRRLRVPPQGTRPTSERVREALFNALAARMDLDGARVLDLYAGSGALGLEALSRGAGYVLMVESNARAAAVVAGTADGEYDIVMLDPPYALEGDELTSVLTDLAAKGWVGEGSLVVVERATRSPETVWPDGFEVERSRRYGDTRVEIACYGLQS